MKYIKLGGELEASAIALGFWRTSALKGSEAAELVSVAVENGVDFFDTADIYGGGESEKLLGRTVKALGLRDKIKIQTKCGIRNGYYDFSKEHIISSVEHSLERLDTDYVDVLLLHRPDALLEPEEVAEAFDTLYSQGKVKYFGVSNHNPSQVELLKSCVNQKLIVNQMQFGLGQSAMVDSGLFVNTTHPSAVDRDGGIINYSRINNMSIQAWSPLQYGFFEGSILENYDKYPELNLAFDKFSSKYNVSEVAVAFAWILRHPAKIQPIAGTTKPERLKKICKACDFDLTREEWYSLYAAAGNKLP